MEWPTLSLLLANFVLPAAALNVPNPTVGCVQSTLSFTAPRRGYHLITDEVNEVLGSQLRQFQCGMCHLVRDPRGEQHP